LMKSLRQHRNGRQPCTFVLSSTFPCIPFPLLATNNMKLALVLAIAAATRSVTAGTIKTPSPSTRVFNSNVSKLFI
ncbi:MAG: hypothetical protein Q8889_01585, partial [Candidatus Phytoplasma australasiaticum]|nr:hypothetical protein [Candidatus Phytoplasma australasiaticum]